MTLDRAGAALLTAVLAVVAAGCSGSDPSPSAPPLLTAGPTASASATRVAPSAAPPAPTPVAGASATAAPSSTTGLPPASPASGSPTATEPLEPAPSDPALAPDLQSLLDDWITEDAAPGAVLGARLLDGRTAVVAAGATDAEEGVPVAPGHRFRIGSITKTFVAALVLQLVDAGAVALDDPLARHLPDAPHADEVTVRQLLDHTSGVFDFAAEPSYRTQMLTAPGRAWLPEDVLVLVADRELDFAPGSDWSYSNTNYVLLGMLVEEVAGERLADLLRDRIHRPLGLESTFLEALEPAPPITVNGHFDIDGDGFPDSLRRIPYTALVTSGAAAGGISASALDVLDFASGLFEGAVLETETLSRMIDVRPPANDYALGVARFQPGGRPAFGHSGGLPGFSTLLVHLPEERLTVVAMANQTGANVALLVERAVGRLLGAEE